MGRRTDVAYSGLAFAEPNQPVPQTFGYNSRSELTDSARNTLQQWVYAYDAIGNRTTSGGSAPNGMWYSSTTYQSNELNQYWRLDRPRGLAPRMAYDADGNLVREYDLVPADMNCDGYVRADDEEALALAIGSTPGNCDPNYVAVFPDCDCMMGDLDNNGVVNWDDYEYFYGHLGDIGVVYKYTWDAENRLTRAEPGDPNDGDLRVDYAYDYMNRRVRKQVYTYVTDPNYPYTVPAWILEEDRRFVSQVTLIRA